MPWCPKCHVQYSEDFDTCAACHVPLTQESSTAAEAGQKSPPSDLGAPVLLLTLYDALKADMLLSTLAKQRIPAFKKIRGAGGYLSIYMGVTSLGVELYVPQLFQQQAMELAETLFLPEGWEELPTVEETPPLQDEFLLVSDEDAADSVAEDKEAPLLRDMGRLMLWLWLIVCILYISWNLSAVLGALWKKLFGVI